MNSQNVKRKLTAILSADVEGYSRLMGADEVGTIRTLTAYRDAMTELILQHRGRVVDDPGDNLLAEFASVVDAVQCAVEIQRELAERNAELPENRKMQFRIGINLGDVVEEEERIYGDGVNIAARMESLAEGGGICISGTVYDHVKNKVKLEYEYIGEQTVKNISEPIAVYRVLSFPGAAAHRVIRAKNAAGMKWRNISLAIAGILILAIAAGMIWNFYLRPYRPQFEVASVAKMSLPLPDKPSIAVLPFDNLSDDPKQEYFSDGISEEIITALSKVPKLFVIARNSTFTYKGKPVKTQQIGRELGVKYVLEGSVRKAGNRVRIAAQLIDATTGHHLWAERYDRELNDFFAVQDEITNKIITALQIKLTEGEQAHLLSKGVNNFQAYLKWLEGLGYIQQFNREANVSARRIAEEVIRLDPNDWRGYSLLAYVNLYDVWLGLSKSPKESLKNAIELTQKAIKKDPSQSDTYRLMAHAYILMRRYDTAIDKAELALEKEPGAANPHATLGHVLLFSSRYQEAIAMLEKAIRLNPYPPSWYFDNLAGCYYATGQFEEAILIYKKALEKAPNDQVALVGLTAAYSLAGRLEEARAAAKNLLRANPKFSVDKYIRRSIHKDKSILRGGEPLYKAGLK